MLADFDLGFDVGLDEVGFDPDIENFEFFSLFEVEFAEDLVDLFAQGDLIAEVGEVNIDVAVVAVEVGVRCAASGGDICPLVVDGFDFFDAGEKVSSVSLDKLESAESLWLHGGDFSSGGGLVEVYRLGFADFLALGEVFSAFAGLILELADLGLFFHHIHEHFLVGGFHAVVEEEIFQVKEFSDCEFSELGFEFSVLEDDSFLFVDDEYSDYSGGELLLLDLE